MQDTWVQSMGLEDPLEKVMAILSSILTWRIPQRSLAGCRPWGHKELNTTEQLSLYAPGLVLGLHLGLCRGRESSPCRAGVDSLWKDKQKQHVSIALCVLRGCLLWSLRSWAKQACGPGAAVREALIRVGNLGVHLEEVRQQAMPEGNTLWVEGMERVKLLLEEKSRNRFVFGSRGCGEKDFEKGGSTPLMHRALWGISLKALETPFFYPDAFSAGVMHKGVRPLRALDISLVPLSSGAWEDGTRWWLRVCCPIPCLPRSVCPQDGSGEEGPRDRGGGQDWETGSSRLLVCLSLLKASCRKLCSAVSRLRSRAFWTCCSWDHREGRDPILSMSAPRTEKAGPHTVHHHPPPH